MEDPKRHELKAQTDRALPDRIQGRLLGHLWQKLRLHLTENNLEPYHQLRINGGRLHVVVGHRSYDTFASRKSPGAGNNTFTVTQNRHHLHHYGISEEVAATWIAEAKALIESQ